MSILVLGSFMMDLVVRSNRAPDNGETIIGNSFSQYPGGKGANQAVSAARLGGTVTMAGKVGIDQFGVEALKTLKQEGVNIDNILRDEKTATGVGFVTLEESGDNRIIVVPGANLKYQEDELNSLKKVIKDSDLMMVQLEMDFSMTEKAINYAYEKGVPVLLNPAPARTLGDKLLKKITYLTPNETEAEIITDIPINSVEDAEKAAKVLLDKGIKNVVITLGKNGALTANSEGIYHVPGYPVKPLDTVAAGDSFNGALAVEIIKGTPLNKAVKFANAVGALTVTKAGAIPSLPTLEETEIFLKSTKRLCSCQKLT